VTHTLVALHPGSCTVARVVKGQADVREVLFADSAGVPEMADAVAARLHDLGYGGEDVCLGLPACMALTGSAPLDGLPRRAQRPALLYRLEEELPVDAEDFTADFLPAEEGRTLGVAVRTHDVRGVIDALASHGVPVSVVCPTALLVAWAVCRHVDAVGRFALIRLPGETNVVRFTQSVPTAWYSMGRDAREDVIRIVEADLLAAPPEGGEPTMHTVGAATEPLTGVRVEPVDAGPLELAALAAEEALAGRGGGWLDLRRDAQAPASPWERVAGLLTSAAALAVLLLLTVTGLALWRGRDYDAVANECEREQQTLFRELYPDRRVPGSVRRYLDGELKQLSGVHGLDHALPSRPSALDMLRDAVASLPPNIRLYITEINCGPGGVFIQGDVTSFTHAEVIARRLHAAGFAVEPPRSERREDGIITFSLAATPAMQEETE